MKNAAAYVAEFQSAACRNPHPGKSQWRCPAKTHGAGYRHGVLSVVASCCFVYGARDVRGVRRFTMQADDALLSLSLPLRLVWFASSHPHFSTDLAL